MNALGRLVGGRYRLTAEVGRGGMGVVWRAVDERLGREVAVKELRFPPLSTDEERSAMVARAVQEARTAGKLDHPNIVAVYDVVEDGGQPFIVMRLVRGHPLDRVVAVTGPLPPDVTARIGLTVLDALSAAHRAGVVHRDVKPANVLVQPDGTVLLTDFSIASVLGAGSRTAAGVLLGTPGYIAPERLTRGTAGPPADLFALGATLYLAVEGAEAFDLGDALSGLFAVATAPHRPPQRAGALAPVLDRLLTKDPAERPDAAVTAEALGVVAAPDGRALASLLAAAPELATEPDHRPPLRPTTVQPMPPIEAGPAPADGPPPFGRGIAAPARPPVETADVLPPGHAPEPVPEPVPAAAGARRGPLGRIAALPRSALAVAGVVVLLALSLTAYVISSTGGKDADLNAAAGVPTTSPTPSVSPSASPSASPPAGLSTAEATLWSALSGDGIDKAACRSGEEPDEFTVEAALVCDTAGALQTQVRYYLFGGPGDYRAHFDDVNDYAEDGPDHDCDTGGNEGYGDWQQQGTVACYWTDRGSWWLTWGDRDALIGAEIEDFDATAVAAWWRANSAFAG